MPDYTLSAKITGDSSGFEKAFSSAQKAAQNFEKVMSTVGKKVSDIGQKMQDAGSKLTGVTTAFAGVAAIGVKYNASMETYSTSFETMTGSAEKAAEIMQQLQKIGAETPFEFEDLAKTTNTLMQFGFTADEAIESMQMLGDISQGSAQKMDSITRAFGKMSSSGKVSLEDINMMIDAGFNPLQEISQTTGESMADLYARISDGAMSVDEITASMQRATSEGGMYFQSMDKQSQTFSGQLSTLSDNAQSFLGNITSGIFEKLAQDILPKINETVSLLNDAFESEGLNGVMGVLQSMVPQLEPVLDFIDALREKLNDLGIDPTMFAGAIAAAGPMLVIFGKITSLTGSTIGGITSITQGIGQFAANMRLAGSSGTVLSGVLATISSPVGILVIAITAAAAAFAYLMATNDEFRTSILDTFSEISASLMPVIEEIGFAFMSLGKTLFSAIGSVLQAIAPAVAQLVEVVGQLLVAIMPVISQLVTLLVPVLEQVILLAAQIVIALIPIVTTLISQLVPVIQQILALAMQVISAVMPLIISLINQLIPFISEIVSLVGNLLAAVVPLITQLISQLVPVISEIISAVSEIISTLLPPLISIIEAIMSVVEALMPPIMEIIDVVVEVISTAIDTISPIIAFITEIIQKIIDIISPIVQFISEIIARIVSFVAPLIETFAGIFGSIFNVVSKIMSNIGEFIGGIFEGVKKAWDGLTGFVSGVIDGISSAFDTVVGTIKSIFNVVIGAINGAIWTINLIPGVHIDEMPYLLHGTDDWKGGFARMNEGGRGELTYLPDGTQVIPHDISVKYAKEAARANVQQAESAVFMIDYDRLAAAMTKVHLTPVVALDGERVSRSLSPYADAEMGDRARQTARGMI
nr:MAG TPA: tail tape measure protein [Caudoviricetes sp.]